MSAEQQEPKERKTLDDRQKMTELERIRVERGALRSEVIVTEAAPDGAPRTTAQ